MFFSTKLGFTISKFHRRISILAVYVNYWTINHFSHSYKRRHLLAIFSSNPSFWKFLFWGIPRFGNFHFEGSLVLEISILRDPSFQEFWDRHETNRLFRRSNSVFRPSYFLPLSFPCPTPNQPILFFSSPFGAGLVELGSQVTPSNPILTLVF